LLGACQSGFGHEIDTFHFPFLAWALVQSNGDTSFL
jgi:hypothetical protein